MIKTIFASLLVAGSVWASSSVDFATDIFQKVLTSSIEAQNVIDWKVGETNTYELGLMGGLMKGTMVQTVRSVDSEGIWMDQNIDLMGNKQTASQLIDPATGEIKKFIVDGKEQELPERGEQEIVEVKEDKVTVPAGTFECIFAKIKDKKTNDIMQAWINPEKVSLGGLLKAIQPSQMGDVNIALKSFIKK